MNEDKLELICDLNLYVAETFDQYYTEDRNNLDADILLRKMANNMRELGKVKIQNKDPERLLMASILLEATKNIISELGKELN